MKTLSTFSECSSPETRKEIFLHAHITEPVDCKHKNRKHGHARIVHSYFSAMNFLAAFVYTNMIEFLVIVWNSANMFYFVEEMD